MNTCDPDLVWTTPHCQNLDHPRLTVQNLTFANGHASGADPGGGRAIFFVSNDRSGALHIHRSHLSDHPSLGFESDPGIFVLAGEIEYTDSVIE